MLPQSVKRLLYEIGPGLCQAGFYMAGGTALALELAHRESVDLDFFRPGEIETDLLARELGAEDILLAQRDTLRFHRSGIKVECLRYDYPLLYETRNLDGIAVAHPLDIGLMKITAIGSRGAKKDFIDLHAITKQFLSLEEIFLMLPMKFGPKVNCVHLLKSLVYFDDAERDPNPGAWDPSRWAEIKQFFVQTVPRIRISSFDGC